MSQPNQSRTNNRRFDPHGEHICPMCRHGHLHEMPMMETLSCNFCRHIFTVNISEQIVRVEDSTTPISWRWSGNRWRSVQSTNQDLTTLIWIGGLAVMLLPPLIVWVPRQIFPPLEGSKAAWFPDVWLVAIVIAHLTIGVWILAEHYQWRPYIQARERFQQFFPEG